MNITFEDSIEVDSQTLPELGCHPAIGRPLRVAFVITSMPVGGAETLLVNLVRRFDRDRILPEIVCLKEPGPLGDVLSKEIPVAHSLLSGKYDIKVLPKLVRHFRKQEIDAVITVGAGDKMFWGRLAAKLAGVPVIASALHSTGWPDGVGRLNRCLTRLTDAFIGVAESHGKFMVEFEHFPKSKVAIIRNGIDTEKFVPDQAARASVREELGLYPNTPLVGFVAALRPEKNHQLFVEIAARTTEKIRDARFVIIGDGPERPAIEKAIADEGLEKKVLLLGTRSDTMRLVAALDVFLLTSHNEANPVSILEALSCGVPVVSSDVGSISETVLNGETGWLFKPGMGCDAARRVMQLLLDTNLAHRFGEQGRSLVETTGSLEVMVDGYRDLIERIFLSKR
jgi:glycosyltransferase involved in cell wall biosynthesis